MEYTVVTSPRVKPFNDEDNSHLEAKVQKLLNEGWKLHAGVSVGMAGGSSGSIVFAQAMVRGKYTTLND